MNRRGFLKMVAGSAAAVGAAFALPRTVEGAVTAPAAPIEPATITLPPNHGFTGISILGPTRESIAIENHSPWNTTEPHTIKVAGPSPTAWAEKWCEAYVASVVDSVSNPTFPNYNEDQRIISSGARGDGFRWTRRIHPKPSADLVDW